MELNAAQKFLLIAKHPEKGGFVISDMFVNYGIIGAILLEMCLEERAVIDDGKLIMKNTKTHDPIVLEISEIIQRESKPRGIKHWVSKLARKSGKYRWAIMTELEKKRLVRIEHKKFLGFIPYKKSYLSDSRVRDGLIRELKEIVLFGKEMSRENLVILGLVEACKMHTVITSDKAELKTVKKELKTLIKESPIAGAVSETIKQMQAAITMAMVASTAGAR